MAAEYPIVVRLTRGWALALQLMLFSAFSIGCIGAAVWGWGHPDDSIPSDWLLVFAVVGPSGIWHALSHRAVLYDRWIEWRKGPHSRELLREDIAGYRMESRRWITLVPKYDHLKAITLPAILLVRQDTAPWFEGLVDLNHARDRLLAKRSSTAFDEPQHYPLEVKLHRDWVILLRLLVFGGLATACGGFAVWLFMHPKVAGLPLGLVLFAAVGIWGIYRTFRDRITFYKSWVERTRMFGSDDLARQDILGYRRSGKRVVLVPIDTKGTSLALPTRILDVPEVAAWFEGLADLDAGTISPDELACRIRLDRLRATASAINGGAAVVCLWALFWPMPYDLAVGTVIALPLLALLLHQLTGGALSLIGEEDRSTVPLGGLLGFPTGVLALRLVLDNDFLDWWQLAAWGAGLGVPGTLYLVASERGFRRSLAAAATALLGAVVYCASALGTADTLWDSATPQKYEVTVLKNRSTYTNHMEFFIKVTPWGPVKEADSIRVPDAVYFRLHEGDRACVYLHRGLFGIAWYELDEC